jgi:Zn-dependent protease
MNFALGILAATALHLVVYLPYLPAQWVAENLENALIINVLLCIFNLLPVPPLDGGRIVVGVLPSRLAAPLARLEPYGMMILIALLFVLPFLGAQLGVNLNVVQQLVAWLTNTVTGMILLLTGNS